jgi:hypothetical protein
MLLFPPGTKRIRKQFLKANKISKTKSYGKLRIYKIIPIYGFRDAVGRMPIIRQQAKRNKVY